MLESAVQVFPRWCWMTIVFDLDGTLVDSAPDIQFVASTILRDQGKAALTTSTRSRRYLARSADVNETEYR